MEGTRIPLEREEFGSWLLRQLQEKETSQYELAKHLKMTRAAVSTWITRGTHPRDDVMNKIAAFLGTTVGSIYNRGPRPPECPTWCGRQTHHDWSWPRRAGQLRTHEQSWHVTDAVSITILAQEIQLSPEESAVLRMAPRVEVDSDEPLNLSVLDTMRLHAELAAVLLSLAEDSIGEANDPTEGIP